MVGTGPHETTLRYSKKEEVPIGASLCFVGVISTKFGKLVLIQSL